MWFDAYLRDTLLPLVFSEGSLILRALRLLLAAALWIVSASASADPTKDQCVDANARAQDLRREGRLSAAREELRQCTSTSCPAVVRNDCTKRLDELETAQATIAFEVKDAAGADVSDVKVTVDGQPLADRLDGTALPVDRGSHVFAFTVAGQPPVTRRFVLTEGEKGRREKIVLGTGVSPPPGPLGVPQGSGSSPVHPQEAGSGMGTQRLLGFVAGGVGLAGIALGSVFGVMTLSEKSQQMTACPSSTCGSAGHAQALDDHSAGLTDSTISTVGFVAGGVLLVGGVLLLLTGGHSSESVATSGISVVPSVGSGGGGMWLKVNF